MKNISVLLYKFSDMDRSSQILLFLIVLVFLMLVSISIINLITKKKNNKYDMENRNFKRYSDLINDDEEKVEIKEKIIEKQSLPKKTNQVEEIESLELDEEPLEVIEVVSNEDSIEDISKLIENTLEHEPFNLTDFEEEQEKEAIISYDELVKKAGTKKIVYKTEEKNKNEVVKKVTKNNVQKPIKKGEYNSTFKASQIVSPIYGIQKEKEPEKFIDLENFDIKNVTPEEEIKRENEFLGSLKTFRNNLD